MHSPRVQDAIYLRETLQSKTAPAEILPHLYLGDVTHAGSPALLRRLGVTALLNVSTSGESPTESDFRYMYLPIHDNMQADLLSWFPQLFHFIDSERACGGKVLVHCRAGVSRSATVCIAYLMQTLQLTTDQAFERVMLARPVVDPNLNFIQQLNRFETQLRDSIDSGRLPRVEGIPARAVPSSTSGGALRSAPPSTDSPSVFTFNTGEAHAQHSSDIRSKSLNEDLNKNCKQPPFSFQPAAFPSFSSFKHDDPGYSCALGQPPKRFKSSESCTTSTTTTTTSSQSAPVQDLRPPSSEMFPFITLQLSPSSLSQMAASPNPTTRPPARPSALQLRHAPSPCEPVTFAPHDPQPGSTPESIPFPVFPLQEPMQSSSLSDIQHMPPEDARVASRFSSSCVPATPLDRCKSFSFFA